MLKVLKVISILYLFIFYNVYILHTQDTEGEVIKSLFGNDTCSAPCWFGITPAKTATNSVMQFIEDNSESINISSQYKEVDSDAEEVYVRFSWANPSVVIPIDSRATIYIVGDIVDFLLIPVKESHSIYDVIELYGEPDVATWYFGRVNRLYFIYVEESIVVTLGILPNTDFNNRDAAFSVYEVRYFSPLDLESIFSAFIYSEVDPEGTRIIPAEILQCWADETNNEPCILGWWDLPKDKDIDLSQWLIPKPIVEITAEPTP